MMAIVFTMREKHYLQIADKKYTVQAIRKWDDFTLINEEGVKFAINCNDWTYLAEGVRVQAGIPRSLKAPLVRVVIDAKGLLVVFGDNIKKGWIL